MRAFSNTYAEAGRPCLANIRPGATSQAHPAGPTVGHFEPHFDPPFGDLYPPEWSDLDPFQRTTGPSGWIGRHTTMPHISDPYFDRDVGHPLALPPGLAGELEPALEPSRQIGGPPGIPPIPPPNCLPSTMLDPYSAATAPSLPVFDDLSIGRNPVVESLLMSLDPATLAKALQAATANPLPHVTDPWSVDTNTLSMPMAQQSLAPPSSLPAAGPSKHHPQPSPPKWTPAGASATVTAATNAEGSLAGPATALASAMVTRKAAHAPAPSSATPNPGPGAGPGPCSVLQRQKGPSTHLAKAAPARSTAQLASSKAPARTASLSTTDGSETRSATSTPLPEADDTKVTRTIVMKNLWCKCGPAMLSDILQAAGFGHLHEEIYVPLRTAVSRAPTNRGYGFVTFVDIPARDACLEYFQGREVRFSHSVRKVEVAFAERRTGSRIQRNQSLWPDNPSATQPSDLELEER